MDLSALSQHSIPLRPFPSALDAKAAAHPDRTWASVPLHSHNLSKGFKDISWREASNAYNNAAWILEKTIGKANDGEYPTVAYIGPSDLRYFFLTVAFAKLGYKTLLKQQSVSVDGQLNLLEKTGCQLIVYGSWNPALDEVLARRPMKTVEAPSIETLMSATNVETYPFPGQSESLLNAPVLILHTSGSTGLPKAITFTYGSFAANALSSDIPPLNGHSTNWQLMRESGRFYIGFPIAHAGGVHVNIVLSAYNNVTVVLIESGNLSGAVFKDMIEYGKIGGILAMPRTLLEVAKSPIGLEKIRQLKSVIWAGGPLPKDVGDAISRRTTLISSWGTTESGAKNLHACDPEDWEYITINPTYNGLHFEHQTDNLFEIVAIRHPDVRIRHYQKIFWNYPELTEWRFGDLFSPHPTKPNLWKYEGRVDDMIILDSGHNVHPMYYEQEILLKDPRVKSAVLLGNGRSNLAVIIELANESADPVDIAWPLVQKLNERSTALAQVPRKNIIIASKEKPLPRGGKGNVVRKLAEKLYEAELASVYQC